MDESRAEEPRAPKRKLVVWGTVVGVAVVVVAVVIVIAIMVNGSGSAKSQVDVSVPPTPSVWPTPTAGSTETVAPLPTEVVPIDEPGDFGDSVTARVVGVERFTSEGGRPGEPGGDAIRVTVEVTNSGSAPVDTKGATVTVDLGDDRVPGPELEVDNPVEFPAILQPGTSVSVVRAFSLPDGSGKSIRVNLDLLVGKPVVVFEGVVPTN